MSRLRLHPDDIKELGKVIADELRPEIRATKTKEDKMEKSIAYTVKEVATMLNLDKTTVYSYLDKGIIQGLKTGRSWRITQQSYNNYLNGNT